MGYTDTRITDLGPTEKITETWRGNGQYGYSTFTLYWLLRYQSVTSYRSTSVRQSSVPGLLGPKTGGTRPKVVHLKPVMSAAEVQRLRIARQLDVHPASFYRLQMLFDLQKEIVCKGSAYTYSVPGSSLLHVVRANEPNLFVPNAKPILPQVPVTSCYNKAFAKQSELAVDWGTALGEVKETIGFLRSPLKSLHTLMREWAKVSKPRRGRSLTKIASTAADCWLEYRYGIMPLVYLTSDSLSAVDRAMRPRVLNSRGSHEPILMEKLYTRMTGRTVWLWHDYLKEQSGSTKATVIILGLHDVQSPLQKYGIDFLSLPRIAWELVPYSFVVDWFFDVGAWIDNIVPHPHWLIKHTLLCKKHTTEYAYRHIKSYVLNHPEYGVCSSENRLRLVTEYMSRTKDPIVENHLQLGSGVSNIKRLLDTLSLGFKPILSTIKRFRK